MIAIGVFVCISFICLVTDFIVGRSDAHPILIYVSQVILASASFAVAWDIVIIQYVCAVQTIITVFHFGHLLDPARFPYHIIAAVRATYLIALLVSSIEGNRAATILFAFVCTASVFESSHSLKVRTIPT
jgi:hypothetical protein